MSADSQITYTVKVNYTQNAESDINHAKLKADVKLLLQQTNVSLGTALATFVSIADVEV